MSFNFNLSTNIDITKKILKFISLLKLLKFKSFCNVNQHYLIIVLLPPPPPPPPPPPFFGGGGGGGGRGGGGRARGVPPVLMLSSLLHSRKTIHFSKMISLTWYF